MKYWYKPKTDHDVFIVVQQSDNEILDYAKTMKELVMIVKKTRRRVKKCVITQSECYVFI